ncbi:hypothetical protein COEREDRAFT_84213 [Coemansia reversa NRRL 1564]|uniref:RING-type domain-containing protein n=1 Tax=Coemansia reversa (strain ATCC 12441 / NRRL 1564) TaxID=763665 RepID=A0A2G5BLE4_COERN|nr:hypothetical protein COEREDRAFT_84213 [Coemansia reversa NRRL 1564]|eukprot:PIA19577.1 hypothetical protein COEREDRAFT_84213 [Coemansia reversa NRRL 1564]
MEHVEFFKSFPLLVPESLAPLKADGYIDIPEGAQVRLCIDTTPMQGAYCVDAIKSTAEAELILQSKKQELDIRFSQCTSAISFVSELRHSLIGILPNNQAKKSKYYSQIVKECDEKVGWDCIETFNDESQTMTANLSCRDSAGRTHSVYINFENETLTSDIEEKSVSMDSICLARYLELLAEKCKKLASCWDTLDDIDESICVLQPQHSKRFELWRRIAVEELATALVEVSPDCNYPRIVVYGPSSVADPLNAKVKKNTNALWSTSRKARKNLEAVLECQLPETNFDQEDVKLDCGICFSFMNDSEAADQLCPNDTCAQPFHRKCLVEWLTTKEDTRQSFVTFFGKCPYCNGSITVDGT